VKSVFLSVLATSLGDAVINVLFTIYLISAALALAVN